MSHTTRVRLHYAADGTRVDREARDNKGQCWCCSGWKRVARRAERRDARDAIRHGHEPSSSHSRWY